jgi:hypothetical protein
LYVEDINGNPTEAPTVQIEELLERTFEAKYQGGFGFDLAYKGFLLLQHSHSLKTLTDSISIYLVCTVQTLLTV